MNYEEVYFNNERVFFKKSSLGWKVINPIIIDGKINWKNLLIGGSWIRFFILIAGILIFLGCVNEYSTAVKLANECILNKVVIP